MYTHEYTHDDNICYEHIRETGPINVSTTRCGWVDFIIRNRTNYAMLFDSKYGWDGLWLIICS